MRIQDNEALTNVRFFNHTVLNVDKSAKAGRPIVDDVEACEITFAANKQTAAVFPAHDEYGYRETDTEFGVMREKITYAMKFNEEYLRFKSGDAASLSGTPLSELPFLTEGRRLELKALKIHTAEALAALDGNALKMLGQGGRDLKNKAVTYLDVAEKTGTVDGVKAELAKRDAEIETMRAQIADLSAGRKIAPAKADKVSAFDTFEDADILNWLTDAKPDHGLNEKSGRDALLSAADAVLATQGRKSAA